ncbi:sensor histidine kinase [Clostridium vincentii]|uniref:histidine kinase n=1 Tax=Clostridium vincentii TaxID=52704 RepID=A0A2T0BCH0_9CLOT|nr:HAMP domain-containing sensor histidine kinase [Clostridium vincentii]PRR81578.1 Alkaline phosphatase synthesis sensor protein PhoR [Clostridium vincentii]
MNYNESLNGLNNLCKEELITVIEEQKRKIGLQEDFLLNISHDLRSPINVMLSILQCVESEIDSEGLKIDEKRKNYRGIIRRNNLKMLKLIDNLMDASKLEKKYYKLEKQTIDIISLIENTATSIEKYAELKEIRIIFDTNEEECVCGVDPQAIDRIVMNLISNALKFSPNGSEVLVSVVVGEEKIKIFVKDEGTGIPEEEQESIFNRFIQAKQNKNKEHSGTGIGLDLVNYLSKAHGGKVELSSTVGHGSEFIVTLPLIILKNEERNYQLESRSKVEQLEVEFSDIYF